MSQPSPPPQPPQQPTTTNSTSTSLTLPTTRSRAATTPTPASSNPFDAPDTTSSLHPPPPSPSPPPDSPPPNPPSNPFLYPDASYDDLSDGAGSGSSPGEDGEGEGDGEGEDGDDGDAHDPADEDGDDPDAAASTLPSSLSSLSPLSSLLTSINPSSSLPPDFCDLSGRWRVDRPSSDPLSPLLAALNVPAPQRQQLEAMDVLTTIHHDPLQHAFTVIDTSPTGQHVTSIHTDGVLRTSSDRAHHTIARRAVEEDGDEDELGADTRHKRHPLRGGVVRVETRLADNVDMTDTRILVDRTTMWQLTTLTRQGQTVCTCRRVYRREESEEERQTGEREWKEKVDITHLMRQAKRAAHHARGVPEGEEAGEGGGYDGDGPGEGEDGEGEEGTEGEEDGEEGEGHMEGAEELDEGEEDEEEEEGDHSSAAPSPPSSTSASPEPTPSNSPLPPLPLPPPPPPADFHASMNGTWSVLKQYSQDVSPILKKMGVSWMDRSMSSSQDQVVMNVGHGILVCVDRSNIGTAELRYSLNGQWSNGMSFGGKEGKVRVATEKERLPFSISIETQWLKDKRSKFQQLVEPSSHHLDFNPAAPPGRRGIPIGFVVCKLKDVRVLERRAIVKQVLQYVENETVRLMCVRYLKKLETPDQRRRGEEAERARADYERLRSAYERDVSRRSQTETVAGKVKAEKARKKTRHPHAAVTTGDEAEVDRIDRLMNIDEKPASPIRYAGGYRRMSMAGGIGVVGMGEVARVTEPNPLLTFLPIRLVLEGKRGGQLYLLMAVLLLVCWCMNNRWATGTLMVLSAFYLHYLEVLGRARSMQRRQSEPRPGAETPPELRNVAEEHEASVSADDKTTAAQDADDGNRSGEAVVNLT